VTALASVAEVNSRLDFDLDDIEKTAVSSALEDLSEEARFYSGESRWEDPETVPALVKTTIAKAVARWARNMNGYVMSRAGDETVGWPQAEAEVGSPSFSARDIKLLKAIGSGRRSPGAFGTISVVAFAPRTDADISIRMADGSKPIPFVDPCGW
jgi:hypothetical protein